MNSQPLHPQTICRTLILSLVFVFSTAGIINAQFTGGIINLCNTTLFTTTVSGIGILVPPGSVTPGYSLTSICIFNIASDHPEMMSISITSPAGTALLLSAFNGGGGNNYVNCCFTYSGDPSITTGLAPFTGNWTAEGGPLSIFDGENANGTWTIAITDTACPILGPAGGGALTPGYFTAGGGFGFTGSPPPPPPPPCIVTLPSYQVTVCQGTPVNILSYYPGLSSSFTSVYHNGFYVSNPMNVYNSGIYMVESWNFMSGCTFEGFLTLTTTPQASLGPDHVINNCSGTPEDLNSLFTLTGFNLDWSLNGSPISSASASSANVSGNYQLVASNSSGCNDTVIVTLNLDPGVSLGPDQMHVRCSYDTINLNTLFNTSGYTANWTHNGISVSDPAAVTAQGNYMLIATTAAGCSDTASVTINNLVTPSLGPDHFVSICSGSTLDLTTIYSTSGLYVQWLVAGLFPVTDPAAVNLPTSYFLVAMAAGSCSDTAIVNLNVFPSPVLGGDQTHTVCTYEQLNLSSLYYTTGYNAIWSLNGQQVINPGNVSALGIYQLVVVDTNNCTDTSTVSLTHSITPVLGADQQTSICSGNTIDITSLFNTSGYSTSWAQGSIALNSPSQVNTPGVYTLIATAATGCSDTANITVNVLTTPILGPDKYIDLCSNLSLNLVQFYNTVGFNTSWSINGSPVANPLSIDTGGNYQLIATVTGGCADTAYININSLPAPALGSNQNIAICEDSAINLTGLYYTTGLSSSWSSGGFPVSAPSLVNTSGNYLLVAVSANGCSDTAGVNLVVNSIPVLGPDQQVEICEGTYVNLTNLYNTAGTMPVWTFGNSLLINPSLVNTAGGYQITVTNSSGCTASANVSLTIHPRPNVGADHQASICSGHATNLESLFQLSAFTTSWYHNGSQITNASSISLPGNYQLMVTDVNGCRDTAMVNVTVMPAPSLGSDQTYSLCPWMTLNLETMFLTTGLNPFYTFNGSTLSAYSAVYDSGVYAINVINSYGCTDQAMVIVENRECLCVADFRSSAECLQDPVSFELLADSAVVSAHWMFGNNSGSDQYALNPTVQFATNDSILVTLKVNLSCGSAETSKYIHLKDCADSCQLYFPNAFTPNGDGLNDNFIWYSICKPKEYVLEIYNRFGELMFKSNDAHIYWDGRYNNMHAPADIYSIRANYKLLYRDKQTFAGKLNLLR